MENQKIIKVIGLEGGPCAGKSSVIAALCEEAMSLGFIPYVNHEVATELKSMGVWFDRIAPVAFQRTLMKFLLFKEDMLKEVAEATNYDNIVIICDRGIIDSKAYLRDKDLYKTLLKELNMNEMEAQIRYDKLIFLNSLAVYQPELYTQLKNSNPTRHENVEEAKEINTLLLEACNGHENVRILPNDSTVERLQFLAKKELRHTLGAPIAIDKQKKFLIKKPWQKDLAKHVNIVPLHIKQTYLTNQGEVIRRVRETSNGENVIYNYFQQEQVGPNVHLIRADKTITRAEYEALLSAADPHYMTIEKDRMCFIANNHSFRLDIFQSYHHNMKLKGDQALLEVDYHSSFDTIVLPDFLEVIRDVTDDECYQNYNLAKRA